MLKILLLSRYGRLAASTRYRFGQYLPYLQQQGINVTEAPLLDDAYLQRFYETGRQKSLSHLIQAYSKRLNHLFRASSYDLIWVQMEVLPWIPNWIERLLLGSRTPYLVDYDDAWFHCYDQHSSCLVRKLLGKKIDRVMKEAAFVVAGNDYIARHAKKAGAKNIEIIPTVVDLEHYPITKQPNNELFTIGWIGTPPTSHHLQSIHDALKVVSQGDHTQVVAIGDTSLKMEGVNLQVKPWNPQTEVEEIERFDVGIMPLFDSSFERGKCGLKLIQYMACARPVIASPVGVNRQIVQDNENGFQAMTTEEWLQAFRLLRANPEKRQQFGQAGRAQIESTYCLQRTAPKIAELLCHSSGGALQGLPIAQEGNYST